MGVGGHVSGNLPAYFAEQRRELDGRFTLLRRRRLHVDARHRAPSGRALGAREDRRVLIDPRRADSDVGRVRVFRGDAREQLRQRRGRLLRAVDFGRFGAAAAIDGFDDSGRGRGVSGHGARF
jgi:hypothetical protein